VFAGLVQGYEVRFLLHAQLGRLASQPTLGLGDLHTLAGSHPGQVRLELGDHRQGGEQQLAHRVGRLVDGPAEVELDLLRLASSRSSWA
jgi:hypothetical protein